MDEFTKRIFSDWARGYRAAARKDRHRKIVAWHEANGYKCTRASARGLVRKTVELVSVIFAYRFMNGWKPKDQRAFLRRQAYDPARSEGRYRLVFNNCGTRWPGVSVLELREVDLCDLYDSTGFVHLDIDRVDGRPTTSRERVRLKKQVEYDFGYDSDDAIRLQFDLAGFHVMPMEAETSGRRST